MPNLPDTPLAAPRATKPDPPAAERAHSSGPLAAERSYGSGPPAAERALDAVCFAAVAIGCAILSLLASPGPIFVDSGIFMSGGMHLLEGKALYTEYWDSKPPGVFLLNALALWLGGAHSGAVHIMESVFAAIAGCSMYAIVRSALGGPWTASAAALIYGLHAVRGLAYEGGNHTEQYAAAFILLGAALVVVSRDRRDGRATASLVAAGAAFGCAVLTKEPFLLSALPWIGFAAVSGPAERPRRMRLLPVLWGAAIPFAAVILWLASYNAVGGWVDATAYNVATTIGASPFGLLLRLVTNAGPAVRNVVLSVPPFIPFVLIGLFTALSRKKRVRYGGLAVVAAAGVLFEYVGTLISPRAYGHYYLQMMPSYVLLGAVGIARATRGLSWSRVFNSRVARHTALVGAFGIAVLGVPWLVRMDFMGEIQSRQHDGTPQPAGSQVARYVAANANPGDTIWATHGANAYYYLWTGLTSPTRYAFVFDHVFVDTPVDTREDKLERLAGELYNAPPRFIVVAERGMPFLEEIGLMNSLRASYRDTGLAEDSPNHTFEPKTVRLYERIDQLHARKR